MTESAPARPLTGTPGWRLLDQSGYLVATAGPDEVWVVDDVPGDVAGELAGCWSTDPPSVEHLSTAARHAVEQLRPLGVFQTPALTPRPRVAIEWSGLEAPGFATTLTRLAGEYGWPEPAAAPAASPPDAATDVTLLVRTTATLDATGRAGTQLVADNRIHLLCDLASARTVAVGPFVVPGHTACAGCLTVRVAHRWGDPAPPDSPGAAEGAGAVLAAGLAMHHIRLATQGRFSLIDAAVSFDLDTAQSRTEPCLRSPHCPVCATIVTDGSVELPWT